MTTRPAISTDVRMIAAGLAANLAVTRPLLITATGRAAPSRYAIVPKGESATFALMPHVDYDDDPDHRPGCGFVGGRLSAIAPFLPAAALVSAGPDVRLRMIPQNRADILRDLRASTGLHWAPGALFAVAGWEDEGVAAWLDRLRADGDEARLIIAHAQAILGVRKMWLAIFWGVGSATGRHQHLAISAGAVAVGRALIDVILIDVIAIVERIAARARTAGATTSDTQDSIARLLTCLHHVVRHLQAADRHNDHGTVTAKLKLVFHWAKLLLDAVAVFSVGAESLRRRWYRLARALDAAKARDHAGPAAPKLGRAGRDLERLRCATLGSRLERTGWRFHIRRSLLRLADPDDGRRLASLDRIRGDLLYQLAATGQLDRLYELFPWLAAPHGAFPGCAGGALGALASLYECGRTMQIGHDLKRRVEDDAGGPGTAVRLKVRAAHTILASPYRTSVAVDRGYAMGAELIRHNISHAMVQAGLAGALLGPDACLTHAQMGRLGWNDAAAYRDRHAVARTVDIMAETLDPLGRSRDDDVPRYMGMTLLRLVNAAIYSIFPTSAQRGDFAGHRDRARDAAKKSGRPKSVPVSLPDGLNGLHDAMLRTLDVDPTTDPDVRDAIADAEPPVSDAPGEVSRARRLRSDATRKSRAYDEPLIGQGRRRRAGAEPVNADPRGDLLRELIDDVRRWRTPLKGSGRGAPRDDLLEDILRGRERLPGFYPVSDLFLPILWFAPFIDRHLLGWIGRGAPAGACAGPHEAAIAEEVGRARGWAAQLYAAGVALGPDDRVACHLFTGVSSVTSDLGHAR